MTSASFRFSPKILARLGEELNQSADQSITELVKNAYDADASTCKIELFDVSRTGGTIVISDDGDGMNAESVREKWLVLGRSSKSPSKLTSLGRTPVGSKGLGRLAALRMGTNVSLQSIERSHSRRLVELQIDWARFESATVVEDVQLEIAVRKNSKGGHGTRTELIGLRAPIGTDELRRLARSLLLLTDPFGDIEKGFQVHLISPEFKEVEALVRRKYFDDASYHLKATVDPSGIATARILDWQSNELAAVDLSTLRRRNRTDRYAAPPATFDLWVFILTPGVEAFTTRSNTKTEIQQWLKQFGGVHVYQDGIRVSPYGDAGNDWLEMNLSRVRSPEERPSTNTAIGRIQLSGHGPNALQQKTDRSGFLENTSFQELRQFAQDSLEWLARWRLELAEKRRSRERSQAPKAARAQKHKVEEAISLAPAGIRKVLSDAFEGYERSRDKEADTLRKEVQLYRTLSTAGITAATFAHESQGNPVKRVELAVASLKKRVPRFVEVGNQAKLMEPLQDIEKATLSLATLGTATLSLVRSAKRRVGRVDIHEVLRQVVALMAPFTAGMTSEIKCELAAGSPYLRSTQAAIESIFANLINNSLAAFERAAAIDRTILITTYMHANTLKVHVADSGPGIVDIRPGDIWLPGHTSKPEGTGLGLTIVRDTIRDMGGEINVVSPGPLGGAEFVFTLPLLGS